MDGVDGVVMIFGYVDDGVGDLNWGGNRVLYLFFVFLD